MHDTSPLQRLHPGVSGKIGNLVFRTLPDLYLVDGCLDGFIDIHTSEYFGVMSVYVVLEDDQGNPIESDYAFENELMRNHWCYVPSASLPSGTTVTIRVIAMDQLGGVGIQSESVTV